MQNFSKMFMRHIISAFMHRTWRGASVVSIRAQIISTKRQPCFHATTSHESYNRIRKDFDRFHRTLSVLCGRFEPHDVHCIFAVYIILDYE